MGLVSFLDGCFGCDVMSLMSVWLSRFGGYQRGFGRGVDLKAKYLDGWMLPFLALGERQSWGVEGFQSTSMTLSDEIDDWR